MIKKMNKKTETKDENTKQPYIFPVEQIIKGAFVYAGRVMQQNINGYFSIKLSAINTIVPLEDDPNCEGCVFYTYKDCCYYVPMSLNELQKAINSFIFEPETHWECYGN